MSKSIEKPPRVVPPLVIDPNQDYSIAEAAAIRRECRAQVYKAITAGTLATFKRGRRRLVSGKELIVRAGASS
jgi:hypothetical protein